MRLPVLLAAAAILVSAAGCAEQKKPLYHWNGYDRRLYEHYRHPQERGAWADGMRQVVTEAERAGRRVPPGIYAEYGYALLENGDASGAITWFERERQLWPESATFMDKMIQSARRASPARDASPAVVRPPPPRGGPTP